MPTSTIHQWLKPPKKKKRRTSPKVVERRRLVAELLKRHLTQAEIARQLGVHKGTICKDVKVIYQDWREAALVDLGSLKGRELVELDEMERECALQFVTAKVHLKPRWIQLRLQIKERRAKMMGLDAPVMNINIDAIDKDLRDMSDDELNELFAKLAEPDAQLKPTVH